MMINFSHFAFCGRVSPAALKMAISVAVLVAVTVFVDACAPAPGTHSQIDRARNLYQLGDYTRAIDQLLPLASEGQREAQFLMGEVYAEGNGVPRNLDEAALWYIRAAYKEHPKAQFTISVMYEFGSGVPEDPIESMYWLRRSAWNGYALAQLRLGSKRLHATDGKPDPVQAYVWYSLAIRSLAGEELQKAFKGRLDADQSMDELQRIEAREMVRAWKPQTVER